MLFIVAILNLGRKHIAINDELYLFSFQMHTKKPKTVKVTMAVIVIAVIDLALPPCPSVTNGSGGNIKICCSGMVHGWIAASLL